MAKPSASELQKAAEAVDLDGFDYEVTIETSAGPISLMLDAAMLAMSAIWLPSPKIILQQRMLRCIIPGLMIQGGCRRKWERWTGYEIDAEFNDTPHEPGVLSMARTSDPNSAGSQFFICLEKVPHLDGQYTAFGRTADDASLQVVKAIGSVPTGAGDRPQQEVAITKATVTKKPKP